MGFLAGYVEPIQKLCEAYQVKALYSFGSVNSDQFNADSDIDFLVDLDITDPLIYADNYFNLKFNLEKILHRSIDLLEDKSLKNPYLRSKIDETKALIYGA